MATFGYIPPFIRKSPLSVEGRGDTGEGKGPSTPKTVPTPK